jgi:hypothetical protein
MVKELVPDGSDRGRCALQQRVSVTSIADRRREHFLDPQRAVVAQQEQEGVEATLRACVPLGLLLEFIGSAEDATLPSSTSGSAPIAKVGGWPGRNFAGTCDRGRIDESLSLFGHG